MRRAKNLGKEGPSGFKAIWSLLGETYAEWSKDNAQTLGAALAFYTTFSTAPLLIIVIEAVGFVLGREAVHTVILVRLNQLVGKEGADAVQNLIKAAYPEGLGVPATILSIVVILIGASSAFVMLRQALNLIWGVKISSEVHILDLVKERLLSFVMILVIGFLLMLSLLSTAVITAIGVLLGQLVPIPIFIFHLADFFLSVSLITLLFASVYRILPDVEIAWSDVWVGAVITAILFTLGKFLLGLYLGRSSYRSAYGAAGSMVVFLLWIYYSAQVFLMGAEFTQVYANHYGSRLTPFTQGKNLGT